MNKGRRLPAGPLLLAVLGAIVLGAFPTPQRPAQMLAQFGALRRHLRL